MSEPFAERPPCRRQIRFVSKGVNPLFILVERIANRETSIMMFRVCEIGIRIISECFETPCPKGALDGGEKIIKRLHNRVDDNHSGCLREVEAVVTRTQRLLALPKR